MTNPRLDQALERIADIHFPMQLARRTASPQTMVEMLSDLEMAVQNAKAVAAEATQVDIEPTES